MDPTPELPGRPMLRRGALFWRADDVLQVGIDPRGGPRVLLAGVDQATAGWLAGLDGGRTLPEVLADPAGPGEARAGSLLRGLARAGALDDCDARPASLRLTTVAERDRLAPELAAAALAWGSPGAGARALDARADGAVRVHGTGRTGSALAALLAAAGVGSVEVAAGRPARPVVPGDVAPCGPAGSDVSRHAAAAVADAVRRAAPGVRTACPGRPDMVVLTEGDGPADGLLAADTPHLLVEVRGTAARVGPLVLPGRTACLTCSDLHRADADRDWPRVAVQLAHREPPPLDTALATLAAALAAAQVLAWFDARGAAAWAQGLAPDPAPAVLGAVLEVEYPHGLVRRSGRPAHPLCGCGWWTRG